MEVGEGSRAGHRRTRAQAARGADEEEVEEKEMAAEGSEEEEAPLRWQGARRAEAQLTQLEQLARGGGDDE